MDYSVTAKDREILRELAKEQLEFSQLPVMRERIELWTLHNDLKGKKPMIHFEMETVGDKGFNPECVCETEAARDIEIVLRRNTANYKMVGDDCVVPDFFGCTYRSSLLPFDMQVKRVNTDGIGYHVEAQIEDLDTYELRPSSYTFDKDGSTEWKNFVEGVVGDILPVKMIMTGFYSCLTNDVVHRMSMENMFVAMYDTPEKFHEMMDTLSSNYVEFYKTLEQKGMLVPNNGNNLVSQGSFGFSESLPDIGPVKTTDCWGFMDSQETVGISPDMFDEFLFPYYKRVADCFGLLSYGCCEPVHTFWDKSLSKFTNLRKISISPWCDEEFMGERLSSRDCIYHRKPSPQFVGVGKDLDEEGFRAHIKKTMSAAKNCKLEVTFRDVYNLEGNLNKPRRAVEIVREEIENNWG